MSAIPPAAAAAAPIASPPPPPPPLWRALHDVLGAASAAACADALAALARASALVTDAASPELDARALQLLAAADLKPRTLLRNVLFQSTAERRKVRRCRSPSPAAAAAVVAAAATAASATSAASAEQGSLNGRPATGASRARARARTRSCAQRTHAPATHARARDARARPQRTFAFATHDALWAARATRSVSPPPRSPRLPSPHPPAGTFRACARDDPGSREALARLCAAL